MSKRHEDVKRQLFKGHHTSHHGGPSLDTPTSTSASNTNLLSKTLRKESDKYRRPSDTTVDEQQFVIHKSTSADDYAIFSSQHPPRDSRLQALSQAETALDELFRRNGDDDSGSEDDEPDLSNVASPNAIKHDDILISVPGYSREEVTASKRLAINERKNVRISRVSSLERGFTDTEFLKQFPHSKIQEYREMNQDFNDRVDTLKAELKQRKLQEEHILQSHSQDTDIHSRNNQLRMELIREAVASLENDSWKFQSPENILRP